MKEHYSIEDILKIDARQHIVKAFKRYGIEGTEDILRRVYETMPKLRNFMLERYKEVIKQYEK